MHAHAAAGHSYVQRGASVIRFPKRYLSKYGQLLEHSPFCERDVRAPQELATYEEKGDFLIRPNL